MGSKTDVELENFYIFNSTYCTKEGEESKKILYYHPITDNIDVRIRNVGLVEGIIKFTSTFKPSSQVSSLHTQKTRQLYYEPEPNFWLVMTLRIPSTKIKDDINTLEYMEDEVQDNVYEAVLKQSYEMYRLFLGSFEYTLKNDDLGTLKTRMESFYRAYLRTLKLNNADILNIFSGIRYLPLEVLTFLKVQSLMNQLECDHPEIIQTAFLYNDRLIWSGIEPKHMKTIYRYLVDTLLPANMETELQGGSLNRNSSSFTSSRHGRFITGPNDLKNEPHMTKIPKVYLYNDDNTLRIYQMIVYRALSSLVCLFVEIQDLSMEFFRELDGFLSPKLTSLVTDIADYCAKQVMTPSNLPDNVPRFIYFDQTNLACRSTVHLDNRQNVVCSKDLIKIVGDINGMKDCFGMAGEMIVKTMDDYWVVAKVSGAREFYIILQQKNVDLADITEEIKKVCEKELKKVFFHTF